MADPEQHQFPSDVAQVSGRHVMFVDVAHVEDEQQSSEHQGSRCSDHWRSPHSAEHHSWSFTEDDEDRRDLRLHEHQLRISVPLISVMETETLQILQQLEKSYRWNLGSHHQMTAEVHKQIQNLRRRIDAKGQRSERQSGPVAMMRDWMCRLTSLMTGGDEDDEESHL